MKGKKSKIQILLSTYNGESYLKEQLDSFLALENYGDVKVLIRDDGSTDGTLAILYEYRDKHGFEIIEGKNLGLNASMYELLAHRDRDCEYYSFSDQDDVWLKDKLSRGINALADFDSSKPCLYCSCSYLTDDDLNILGHTFVPKRKLSFYNAMIQNVCPGHAQICNKAFADVLSEKYSDGIMVFDYWCYLLASAIGTVVFDPTPTTLYRQHKSNAIGCEHSRLKILKIRISRVKSKVSAENARQLKALYDVCFDIIPDEYKKETERFFKGQRNVFTRIGYLFRSKSYRQTPIETLIFRFMYLFGRYNLANKNIKIQTTQEKQQ